jgi:hypothetical protein
MRSEGQAANGGKVDTPLRPRVMRKTMEEVVTQNKYVLPGYDAT